MPVEVWTSIYSAILYVGQEVDCRPILYWLRVALTKNVGNYKSPLYLLRPTALLDDRDLITHRHHNLTRHLPRLDLALQRVQGSLIATQIGEVTVEILW